MGSAAMLLTSANLIRYLLDRQYLPPASAIDGSFEVEESVSRNRSFRVTFGPASGYWVKQIREWTDANMTTFAQEARWYWLVGHDMRFARFSRLVPRCHGYDAASQILVMERFVDGLPLRDLTAGTARFTVAVAKLLGHAISGYQQDSKPCALELGPRGALPKALTIAGATDERDLNPAKREILRILAKHGDYRDRLKALRAEWEPASLIHGDMKFENCVWNGASLRLIDWELARWGDPCWDAAGILQGYWSDWIRERVTLAEMRTAASAFCESYLEASGFARQTLHRVVRFAAARLVQSVWEEWRSKAKSSEPSAKMLQLSRNVLNDPEEAIRDLVGL